MFTEDDTTCRILLELAGPVSQSVADVDDFVVPNLQVQLARQLEEVRMHANMQGTLPTRSYSCYISFCCLFFNRLDVSPTYANHHQRL